MPTCRATLPLPEFEYSQFPRGDHEVCGNDVAVQVLARRPQSSAPYPCRAFTPHFLAFKALSMPPSPPINSPHTWN